jgi:hypothetical protein
MRDNIKVGLKGYSMWAGLIWLGQRSALGCFEYGIEPTVSITRAGFSCVAEQLLVSQEGLYPMELIKA